MYNISESCYQCGLPLPSRPVSHEVSGEEVSYCCYGCLLTNGITGEKGEEGEALWILLRLGLSAFFAMNIMILSFTGYIYPFDGNIETTINHISMVLAFPIMFLLGLPILKNSLRSISDLTLNMDVLIVIGTFSAFTLSVYSTLKGESKVYFDTASMILVLVTVGRLLEANAKAQASNAVKALLELSPKEATIVRDGKEEKLPIESLRKEDILRVIPGEIFPVDGEVIEGESSVDESMLTGESKPVFKERGSMVFSGSKNLDGMLIFRVTKVGKDMFLSRFVKILEEARRVRAPIERFADRVSATFIPIAISISVLTFLFWFYKSGIDSALMNSLSVLLISCPCALGIATPMAIWVSLGRAAKEGILIRTAETLEKLSHIKRLFFDKTGTLTKRNVKLSSIFIEPKADINERFLISVAASLEHASAHPLAESVVQYALVHGYPLYPVSQFKAFPGMGLQGKINSRSVYIGNNRFLERMGLTKSEMIANKGKELESGGITVAYCGWDTEVKGILEFSEEIRGEAAEAISRLKKFGLEIIILTGDNRYAAKAISKNIGVENISELYPEDKVKEIKSFKNGLSAMVGDGINDVPALSAADVGIALECGMDLARETAEINLLGNDLRKIPWIIKLAKITLRTVKENLFLAFLYNIAGIGLAVSGLLQPVIAAIAMILSSVLVLGNSLRLQNTR